MTTLNLSPKNPIVLAALVAGALYFVARRPASAATTYKAPTVGAPAVNNNLSTIISAVGSWLGSAGGSTNSTVLDGARAATRINDPYYGGAGESAGVGGNVPGWSLQPADAQAWLAAGGDPYNEYGIY